jgi:hypothetical protein
VKLIEYRAQHESDDPHLWCMPMGVPRSTPYPFKFVQDMTGSTATAHLYILHEGNIHSFRQIFMDGRKHPAELDPTWFGHSIGHWENKDTLVIDTVGSRSASTTSSGSTATALLTASSSTSSSGGRGRTWGRWSTR